MKRKNLNSQGSALVILLVVILLTVIGFVVWRVLAGNNSLTNEDSIKKDQSDSNFSFAKANLELQNLGLESLELNQFNQNALREFESKGMKGFYVFGDKLSGNRQNPNFEFSSIKPGTKIISALDGTVVEVKSQDESSDSEIIIQAGDDSPWTVGYDHLTKVTLKRGDKVKSGDILGEASMQNNGLLRFEIQVNKDENGETTHVCPTTLLSESVKEKWVSQLTSHQNQWEESSGLEMYDLSAQNPVGCLKTSLTPAEAEGR